MPLMVMCDQGLDGIDYTWKDKIENLYKIASYFYQDSMVSWKPLDLMQAIV